MAYVEQGDFNQVICTNYGVKAIVVLIHSHNIIKQYMHTVAYIALHAQDILPDLSIGALGDNCYLPNTYTVTLQGCGKLF